MATINPSRRIRLQNRANHLLTEGNDEITTAAVMVAEQLCSEAIARKIVSWVIANSEPGIQGPHAQAKDDGLTMREREIANYLAQGPTKPLIAQKLAINYGTVKAHCRNISKKWGMHTEDTALLQAEAKRREHDLERPIA